MQAHQLRVDITLLVVTGLLLADPGWTQLALADEPSLANLTSAPTTTSQIPTEPLWTTWGAPQYALADDGPALWIGATGGVVRWDKAQGTHQRYTTLDRLPHTVVLAAAVDSAGNRWFGGDGSLSRLAANGAWTHFTPTNSALHRTLVDGIAVGADNTLWLSHGLPDGRISRRNPDGSWSWFPNRAAAVASDYARLVQAPMPNPLWTVVNGEVWMGFLVYTGSQWLDRTPSAVQSQPDLLRADSTGKVWALVKDSYNVAQLYQWTPDAWTEIDLWRYLPLGGNVTTFAIAPDDTVWLGLAFRHSPYANLIAALAKVEPNPTPIVLSRPSPVTALLANAAGITAIGPGWLHTPDGMMHDFADTVAYPTLVDMINDRQGALWVNSDNQHPYSPGALQTLNDQGSAALGDDVWSTQTSNYPIVLAWERTPGGDLLSAWGSLDRFGWLCSPTLRRDRQGAVLEIPLPKTDPQTGINDIFAQDDRHSWLAYTRGALDMSREQGVLALDDNGTPADFADDRWRDYPLATTGEGGTVAVDARGRLWYGNSVNLYQYRDGQWQPFFAGGRHVCDLTVDGAGVLYVLEAIGDQCHSANGVVGLIAPDNLYTSDVISRIVAERLSALQTTPYRNRLWTVAPDGAVWYVSQRYVSASGGGYVNELNRQDTTGVTRTPLPVAAAQVQRLEVDAHNHVWLAANNQLWRLSPAPDFVLDIQPNSWLLTPARVGAGQITLHSSGGYSGTVTLAVINPPSALTVTMEPNPAPIGQAVRLTLVATPDSLPATYPLLIAASDNAITHTVTLTVAVAAQLYDFYLPVIAN